MEERKQQNNFKFGLFLRNEKVAEKVFSADLYNPVVRYSVNIREMIPSIIGSLQKTLQTPSDELTFVDQYDYNSVDYYKAICDINDLDYFKLKVPTPYQRPNNHVHGKPFVQRNGTEFKFGLYINTNTIVERNFYVDNYNPAARFSQELVSSSCDNKKNGAYGTIDRIVSDLQDHLKKADLNHMWDDYKIITTYSLNIQQVRELTKEKREEFLRRVGDYNFIERVRIDYNKQPEFAV